VRDPKATGSPIEPFGEDAREKFPSFPHVSGGNPASLRRSRAFLLFLISYLLFAFIILSLIFAKCEVPGAKC